MAGTVAAIAASKAGAEVTLVSRGPGASSLSPGVLDVAWPESVATLAARPGHPFFVLREALADIPKALAFTTEILSPLFEGSPAEGWYATVLGTRRRAGHVQQSQAQGRLEPGRRFAVAGLQLQPGLLDEELVAQSLGQLGFPAKACRVAYLDRDGDVALSPFALAARLDRPEEGERFAEALRRVVPDGCDAVLLPPILGVGSSARLVARISEKLGMPCAELLPVVPAVPGLRLAQALAAARIRQGVRVIDDTLVHLDAGHADLASGEAITFQAAVLATGRFLGGGIVRSAKTTEALCNLPVSDGLRPLDDEAGPGALAGVEVGAVAALFQCGVDVDSGLHARDAQGHSLSWLYAAGSVLAGADGAVDGTGLGFAAFTGWLAGRSAARG